MMAPTTTFDKQVPLLIRNLENALRSGYNVRQALEIVAQDLPAPLGEEAQRTVSELEAGTPFPEALNHWLERVPSADLDLVLATIKVQLEVGGNLADKLQLLGQILEKRASAQ